MRAANLKTVVKQIDPAQERRRLLLRIGIVILAAVLGLFAGRELALSEGVPLEDPTAELNGRIARLETRAQVDRNTMSELRSDLAESRAQVDELERELVFYREVLAPEEQGALLVLREPTLLPAESAGVWQYRFVVQQGARTDSARRGDLTVAILGEQSGEPATLNLTDLDGEWASDALPLNFRYFQRFSGELTLPTDFEPQAVQLTAALVKPREVTIEKTFAWPGVALDRQDPPKNSSEDDADERT